jgi:type IV pilus assembly protein PilO
MSLRSADRLWVIAGTAVVALLGVITWLMLVAPQHTEAADLRSQTESTETQAALVRARTAKLAAAQARIGELTRERSALATALPSGSGIPAFLRQLQTTGVSVGADISGLTVGDPNEMESLPGVWEVPIQLTAEGTATQLGAFLDRLQRSGRTRAVLISDANLSGGGVEAGGGNPRLILALSIRAFVAPPAGAGAPLVTAD